MLYGQRVSSKIITARHQLSLSKIILSEDFTADKSIEHAMQSLTGENFGSPGFLGGGNIKGNLPGNLNTSENLGLSRK